jgi:hypothetical protein
MNQLKSIFEQNQITGILIMADKNDNLYEMLYFGETFTPVFEKSNLYLKSNDSNYTIQQFINKVKTEQHQLSLQGSASLSESDGEDSGND